MGRWNIDTESWPIVLHTVEGSLSNEEVDAYVQAATGVLAQARPHVTVMDASRMGSVSAYTRSRAMGWQRQYFQELHQHCLGTAYVLKSPLLRFMAMTVLMVTKLPTPLRVCESLDEALAWADARLAKA